MGKKKANIFIYVILGILTVVVLYPLYFIVLNSFKGKFYIVPGWKIKLARFGAKLAPASFVAKISYNMQKRKIR